MKKIFAFFWVSIFLLGCQQKYSSAANRYSFVIPSDMQYFDLAKTQIDEEFSLVLNFANADVIFYKEPFLIMSAMTYPRYFNITSTVTSATVEENITLALLKNFGNGECIGRETRQTGKRTSAYITFVFEFNGLDYVYEIQFFSGSISSTQAFYYLAEKGNEYLIHEAQQVIERSYRRF